MKVLVAFTLMFGEFFLNMMVAIKRYLMYIRKKKKRHHYTIYFHWNCNAMIEGRNISYSLMATCNGPHLVQVEFEPLSSNINLAVL